MIIFFWPIPIDSPSPFYQVSEKSLVMENSQVYAKIDKFFCYTKIYNHIWQKLVFILLF